MNEINTTTEPVRAGNFTASNQEYGRCADVQRVFGLKRGTVYNLLADGKIRGCLLRVKGSKSGVRLIYMPSVREFIESHMPSPHVAGPHNHLN
jgi:hypothetical protein